ncbi:hypothetical protein Poli38472_011034 [Pythium oligandrum]|uniref:Protochlorophyllide reductase n=1 Tax=Pythium oligandrum TaxID=41045 RepID=A0A8K1CQJ6_PYTOL|nr:hypothetical protein Poli38472_011034 [Pythium oligandrum]|eukprot:TMW67414.1 hypothetical protein Poli38472_011034 [Pythium oligandrum]
MSSNAKKVIIVTGGTTGIGLECGRALAKYDNVHVIITGRNKQRVDNAITEMKQTAAASSIVEGSIMDNANLKSVRDFANSIRDRDLQLFSIVGNAGIHNTKKELSPDGFESIMATNHIGHFLLVKLLLGRTKRVVMVSSEAHDPTEKTLSPPPDMSDLDQLAFGREKFHGMGAYGESKLCNMLHVKEIARSHRKEALAYSPGFTPDTEFLRRYPRIFAALLKFFVRKIFPLFMSIRVNSAKSAGEFLALMATADSIAANGWRNGDYILIDKVHKESEQARDPVLAKQLWDKSEEWVKPFVH